MQMIFHFSLQKRKAIHANASHKNKRNKRYYEERMAEKQHDYEDCPRLKIALEDVAEKQRAHEERTVEKQRAHEERTVEKQRAHEEGMAEKQRAHEERMAAHEERMADHQQRMGDIMLSIVNKLNDHDERISTATRRESDSIELGVILMSWTLRLVPMHLLLIDFVSDFVIASIYVTMFCSGFPAPYNHVEHHWSERWMTILRHLLFVFSVMSRAEPCGVPLLDASPTWHCFCLWCQASQRESGDACDLGPSLFFLLFVSVKEVEQDPIKGGMLSEYDCRGICSIFSLRKRRMQSDQNWNCPFVLSVDGLISERPMNYVLSGLSGLNKCNI
ncbi:hypothetical protein Dimus_019175 [Dionaea muscipula]